MIIVGTSLAAFWEFLHLLQGSFEKIVEVCLRLKEAVSQKRAPMEQRTLRAQFGLFNAATWPVTWESNFSVCKEEKNGT
jgi:hypothetical protein